MIPIQNIIFVVGLAVTVRFLLFFVKFVKKHFLRRPFNLIERYGANSWACVTGCTGGIGEVFCEELAKMGFNIILVSRNQEKLNAMAKKLRELNPKIMTDIVISDFEKETSIESFREIGNKINKHDVSFLMNNAGVLHAGCLAEVDDTLLKNMVNVNCLPHVMVSRYVMEKMLKREKRSGIIITASLAAMRETPSNSLYSATKAFVDFFARGIHHEVKNKIDVLSLRPCFVSTNMTKQMNESFVCISARACVKSALRDLGHEVTTNGHWKHELAGYSVYYSPEYINTRTNFKATKEVFLKKK